MIVTSICCSYREGTRCETKILRRTDRGKGPRKDIDLFLYLRDAIDGCTPRRFRFGEALESHAGHPDFEAHARGQRCPVGDSALIWRRRMQEGRP
jgi:hypothetical protein